MPEMTQAQADQFIKELDAINADTIAKGQRSQVHNEKLRRLDMIMDKLNFHCDEAQKLLNRIESIERGDAQEIIQTLNKIIDTVRIFTPHCNECDDLTKAVEGIHCSDFYDRIAKMPNTPEPPTEEAPIDWQATAGNLRHRLNEAQGGIDQFVLAAERSGAVYCDGETVENLRDITALLISGEITLSCKEPQE